MGGTRTTHPVQKSIGRAQSRVSTKVTGAAYEVYCELYGEQPAMMDDLGRGCRGGFSTGELLAFLYARRFPRSEWRARVAEAFDGMKYL